MKTASNLRSKLREIDHKGYPAYKDLRGEYDFGEYVLSIDHVQGDPFAAPSRLSVRVDRARAGFPEQYYKKHVNRVTLQDHLTRLFAGQVQGGTFQAKGSGKSGLLSVSHCGQQVLERTACKVSDGAVTIRFEAGFPANGRTINAGELEKMLFQILPGCVQKSLFYKNIDQKALSRAIELCEDQQYIREHLEEAGLCAFIANGSILPRQSGISEKPMKGAVAFRSPASMEVTMDLPHRGPISGMGIRKGITLFVGGGYHGKSTVLQALQDGVYNHVFGDGRELVITDESAFKLRAEDGRSVVNVDISPFIDHLPNGKDTRHFSTEDASGSTSQAANLMESIESGSRLLLIDEDTSATNFMIRDELMQQVVAAGEEPITPFLQRVESLYDDLGISSIIVAGSSGAYFRVADSVIQMKEYVPLDITERAKRAAFLGDGEKQKGSLERDKFPAFTGSRIPRANAALRGQDRLKIKSMGTSEILIDREMVELRYLEQLKDGEQAMALAQILCFVQTTMMDGKKTMGRIADLLEKQMDEKGLESLFERGDVRSSLARPRRQEIMACINRYRKLQF
ncbi:MAG: isopentenyl-diphosphate delta-isomerase [Lachnospiraceae bacterium]|nr:isopentenyl-diphosphate delta-isomerase [Lachnospiraceae bacterium]